MHISRMESMQFEPTRISIGGFELESGAPVLIGASELTINFQSPIKSDNKVAISVNRRHITKTIISFGEKTRFLFIVLQKCGDNILSSLFNGTHSENIDGKYILIETQDKLDKTKFPRTINVNDEITPDEMTAFIKRKIKKSVNVRPVPVVNDSIILTYPSVGPGAISITKNDFKCLAADEFLNDVIINFFIKYLFEEVLDANQKAITYIFDTFFYETLAGASRASKQKQHSRVENWTKRVNIFEKDFVIVPINQSLHWFLAIICFPGVQLTDRKKRKSTKKTEDNDESGTGENEKRPCILIFDSLSSDERKDVVKKLRNYLNSEYKAKFTDANDYTFDIDNMPGHSVRVPRQNNITDCGLFMLQYIEQFFKDPITDFKLPIKNLNKWFETSVATQKRAEIVNIIKGKMINQDPDGLNPVVKLPEIRLPEPS